MKLSQAYPSRFLTAEDLGGRDVTVTISRVDLEDMGQGREKQTKLVLSFHGKSKAMVCNKTNARTIEKVLGTEETDDWIGQRITIGAREVEFQGDMVLALRVSLKPPGAPKTTPGIAKPPPPPAPAPEPPPSEPAPQEPDPNEDEVPF